jgi:alpha-tubulin suppressor-like RCC1 family protein
MRTKTRALMTMTACAVTGALLLTGCGGGDKPSTGQGRGQDKQNTTSEDEPKEPEAKGGNVWAWGRGSSGQLGNGAENDSYEPVEVTGLTNVVSVVGQSENGYALDADGQVWSWGSNQYGYLGNGSDEKESAIAGIVPGMPPIIQIAGVKYAGVGVDGEGSVWAWGTSLTLPKGVGNARTPVKLPGLSNITAVGGGYYPLAIDKDGAVWDWNGGTPVPAKIDGLPAIEVVAADDVNAYAIDGDEALWSWERGPAPTPAKVAGLPKVTAVAARGRTVIALDTDGNVWTWGLNEHGQLGNGTKGDSNPNAVGAPPAQVQGVPKATAVTLSGRNGYALDADGTVWCWGQNTEGQCGDGTVEDRYTPVKVSGLSNVIGIGAAEDAGYAIQRP